MLWQIRLTDFSSHTVKLPKIKYVQIKTESKKAPFLYAKKDRIL